MQNPTDESIHDLANAAKGISLRNEKDNKTLLDFIPYPMIVLNLDGTLVYLNPAFTRIFGWTYLELKGKQIPYVPLDLSQEIKENTKKLFEEKIIQRYETKRLTKHGQLLDVIMKKVILSNQEGQPGGELIIIRDTTNEKRLAKNKDALLRISNALPQYPDLEDLLDYISQEIKQLLNTERAIVILLDQEKQELFFLGAAYEDNSIQKRAKEIRFPADQGVSGQVIKTGEPVIVSNTSEGPDFSIDVGRALGLKSRNRLGLPVKSGDRIIGVLVASNKKEGNFDKTDVEFLRMIASTVALSIENARFSRELKSAYHEVSSMNRAKDRVINHLSHELKTPAAILLASQKIIENYLKALPNSNWKPTMERMRRNLIRLIDIQYETSDIIENKEYRAPKLLNILLEQCKDIIETNLTDMVGEGSLIEELRKRFDALFEIKESTPVSLKLGEYIEERIDTLKDLFKHRNVQIIKKLSLVPMISIPPDVLEKVFDGLFRNAIENTPDDGVIEISLDKKGEWVELIIHDYGVGIFQEFQRRIFEGFFSTLDNIHYSSKRAYDFNAGGKGADLLRIKIFSERYGFKINLDSKRCIYLRDKKDICPGKISECEHCSKTTDCRESGGTTFTLLFSIA